jgi:hypothetical protein
MTVFLLDSSAVALGEKAKPRSAKPNTVGAAFKNVIRSPCGVANSGVPNSDVSNSGFLNPNVLSSASLCSRSARQD